jgi:hypothetical protein
VGVNCVRQDGGCNVYDGLVELPVCSGVPRGFGGFKPLQGDP